MSLTSRLAARRAKRSVSALRRALGEKRGERVFIETVRKHGYRFAAEVARRKRRFFCSRNFTGNQFAVRRAENFR